MIFAMCEMLLHITMRSLSREWRLRCIYFQKVVMATDCAKMVIPQTVGLCLPKNGYQKS